MMKRTTRWMAVLMVMALIPSVGEGRSADRSPLDLWHVPVASEPPGSTMRRPLAPAAGDEVDVWLGAAGVGVMDASRCRYRLVGGGSWETAPMAREVVLEDVEYWLAILPGAFPAGSEIEYYFAGEADGYDETFVFGDDESSQVTLVESEAQAGAYRYQVSPSPTETPIPTMPPPSPTPLPTMTATPSPRPTPSPPATPTPSFPSPTPSWPPSTPSPGPTVTPTPGDQIGSLLRLNGTEFTSGQRFRLQMDIWNRTAWEVDALQFVLLDVYGAYYYYPSWGQAIDGIGLNLPAGQTFTDTILDFDWPEGAGEATGLYFHGALMDPASIQVYGSITSTPFSYR